MFATFNEKAWGDCLVVAMAGNESQQVESTRVGKVAQQKVADKVIGYSFFNVKKAIPALKNAQGQVFLDGEAIDYLNAQLFDAGFDTVLTEKDFQPQFVVGYVEECVEHPDSDHLHITQTRVDGDQVLQIVCGAPNIAAGQKVVVAKPSAMMPDGAMIWQGALRGVESDGMICSAREMHLKDAPDERGILVLDDTAEVGSIFQPAIDVIMNH